MVNKSKKVMGKLFLSLILGIFLMASAFALPTFDDFSVNPANASAYVSGQIYKFNTTIDDTNGTVGIQFNGVNYTVTSVGDVYTASITGLSAGTYNYFWWAYNDTDFNNTATFSYTINKANLRGTLTSSAGWTINYLVSTTIGISETNNGDGDVTYKIYKDGVYIGSGETGAFPIGTYNYKLNSTGGTNYSSNSSINTKTLSIAREESGQQIYSVLSGTGAGLGIFVQYMGQALPSLIIILAMIGIVVAIGMAIAYVVKRSIQSIRVR